MSNNIESLAVVPVLHRSEAQGERIAKLELISVNGALVIVEHWANWTTGKLSRLVGPRALRSGERELFPA